MSDETAKFLGSLLLVPLHEGCEKLDAHDAALAARVFEACARACEERSALAKRDECFEAAVEATFCAAKIRLLSKKWSGG